jgi:hypothetical protein
VEVEHGERELEGRKQQINALLKNIQPSPKATAEDVAGAAREVLTATADLVLANDQGALIDVGRTAYDSVEKLLSQSVMALKLSPDTSVQRAITGAAANTTRSMVELLEVAKLNRRRHRS